MECKTVLISIHPAHIEKIIAGKKKLEFRRNWTSLPVDNLVIYATFPVQRVLALCKIKNVFIGSKTMIWNLAKNKGGCISRRKLFAYLDGKKTGVAIEMAGIKPISGGLDPGRLFGDSFRPPQSFRYLKNDEYSKLKKLIDTE